MRIGFASANKLARYQSLIVPWSRSFASQSHVPGQTIWTYRENEQEMQNEGLSGRIHILGVGNIGCFVAHSLASRMTRPPITILLHNRDTYERWLQRQQTIRLMTNGSDDNKTGFDVNVWDNNTWHSIPYYDERNPRASSGEPGVDTPSSEAGKSGTDDERIECLIVATKAPITIKALSTVSHRLTPDSTILFLQNGMGLIDEVNEKIFPDASLRPHYLQGIVSHGVKMRKPFHIEYAGLGTTIIGRQPSSITESTVESTIDKKPPMAGWAPSTTYLARTLTLTPPLVAVVKPPIDFLQSQLEKLAMNCVINPLTALLDVKNGELLYNYSMTRTMRMLLAEISTVICALPELDGVPGVKERFSVERLKNLVKRLANATAENTSSMLQDMYAMKTTEVGYINGYIVRRGDELGIRCALNYMIMQLVMGKSHISKLREAGAVPLSPLEAEEMDGEEGL